MVIVEDEAPVQDIKRKSKKVRNYFLAEIVHHKVAVTRERANPFRRRRRVNLWKWRNRLWK